MDPRIVLEVVVKRLEDPALQLGNVSRGQFSAWEGQEDPLQKRWAHGRGHLAHALRMARSALSTQDPTSINEAALICPGYEREGLKRIAVQPQRAGGKKRGDNLHSAAEKAWEPYIEQFSEQGRTERLGWQLSLA
jgi:hypothetical protein